MCNLDCLDSSILYEFFPFYLLNLNQNCLHCSWNKSEYLSIKSGLGCFGAYKTIIHMVLHSGENDESIEGNCFGWSVIDGLNKSDKLR